MSETIIPKEKNIKIYVNGIKLKTLVSFETDSEHSYTPLRELLSGETDYIKSSETHILKLTVLSEEEVPQDCVLKIQTPSSEKTYSDCRVVSLKEKAVAGEKFQREYTLKAQALHSRKVSG